MEEAYLSKYESNKTLLREISDYKNNTPLQEVENINDNVTKNKEIQGNISLIYNNPKYTKNIQKIKMKELESSIKPLLKTNYIIREKVNKSYWVHGEAEEADVYVYRNKYYDDLSSIFGGWQNSLKDNVVDYFTQLPDDSFKKNTLKNIWDRMNNEWLFWIEENTSIKKYDDEILSITEWKITKLPHMKIFTWDVINTVYPGSIGPRPILSNKETKKYPLYDEEPTHEDLDLGGGKRRRKRRSNFRRKTNKRRKKNKKSRHTKKNKK